MSNLNVINTLAHTLNDAVRALGKVEVEVVLALLGDIDKPGVVQNPGADIEFA